MAALQAIRQNTKMDALLLFRNIWELEKAATIAKRSIMADTVENQSIDFSSC